MGYVENPDLPAVTFKGEPIECLVTDDRFQWGFTHTTVYGAYGPEDKIHRFPVSVVVETRNIPESHVPNAVRFAVNASLLGTEPHPTSLSFMISDPKYPPTSPEEVDSYNNSIHKVAQSALDALVTLLGTVKAAN